VQGARGPSTDNAGEEQRAGERGRAVTVGRSVARVVEDSTGEGGGREGEME
jgi:hypothetical protein